MPAPDSFVDTNVLLYAISTEASEATKAATAQQLLATANRAWSAQVAAEFLNASASPRRPTPLTLAEAEQWIDLWLAFPLVSIDARIVKDAIRLAQRYQVSYLDAQIIAAARSLECDVLYSEALNHGQDYDGIVVTNPFTQVTSG
jgi:predicted nucleic acid-binding protein